jgi:hypothetical protein
MRLEPALPEWERPLPDDDSPARGGRRTGAMVNHFEGTGIKREKYGKPETAKLAKEIMDLLRCTLQIAIYYGIEEELETRINEAYVKMQSEGLIEE